MSILICFVFLLFVFLPLIEYFSSFLDGAVVAMFESEEDEDDDAALVMRR